LVFGLFLCSVGIVLTLRANIGYATWDVFHDGASKTMGIPIGMTGIIVGLIILILVSFMKEKFGIGTILNMLLIGILIDTLLNSEILPLAGGAVSGFLMLMAGLFIISFGAYFYIGAGFGAGPRDSLMVVLMRKTNKSAGFCRVVIEFATVLIGWVLGGMAGVGTVISAFGIGFCVQIVFNLLKFDAAAVEHETLAETYKKLFNKKI
jgi:uncharacterized membrane protein YczE